MRCKCRCALPLIGLYIGKQALESTYGAAASIVVVLIWVYYTAQLVLMGAENSHRRLLRARRERPRGCAAECGQ
ncbi:MAG TPA: YhjD/YihY/BrkB family envelope integrity protein [Hyphomicrobiaceae bacterium]|nr:YhjD/YihY/BrkB family envelope integrity protein [Hyphomicrobiaceae bacterium]